MSPTAQIAVRSAQRAEQLRTALDRAELTGGIIAIQGTGSADLVVDAGTLREVLPVLSVWGAQHSMATWVYSLGDGLRTLDAPGGPTTHIPSQVTGQTPVTDLQRIRDDVLERSEKVLLAIKDANALLPNNAEEGFGHEDRARLFETVGALATDPAWKSAGHRLVLLARAGSIDDRLARLPGVTMIELGLPQREERNAALTLMQESTTHPLILTEDLDLGRAAHLTGGLYLHGLNAMRHTSRTTSPIGLEDVIELKRRELARVAGDVLTIHKESVTMDADVAGLPQIRRMLKEETATGSPTLRIGLYGPPGVGKTWVATAIAASLGVVAVSPRDVKDRWVGSSERNQRRMLDAISSLAPVALIIDEAESAGLGARSNHGDTDGSDVNGALRGMMFEFLGDVGEQSGIHVIAMSNYPTKLDSAARDRLTGIPVLHPTPRELGQVMGIQARRMQIDFDLDGATRALIEANQSFSGRHGVRLLRRAQIFAREEHRTDVQGIDVARAIKDSMYQIDPTEELQCLLAIQATSWQGHLPWQAAQWLGHKDATPPAYLAPYVNPDGSINPDSLAARIQELQARHGR